MTWLLLTIAATLIGAAWTCTIMTNNYNLVMFLFRSANVAFFVAMANMIKTCL